MANEIEYRLIVRDDGTAVLKKFQQQVTDTTAKIESKPAQVQVTAVGAEKVTAQLDTLIARSALLEKGIHPLITVPGADAAISQIEAIRGVAKQTVVDTKGLSNIPVTSTGATETSAKLNEISSAAEKVSASAKSLSPIPISSPGAVDTATNLDKLVSAAERVIDKSKGLSTLKVDVLGTEETKSKLEGISASVEKVINSSRKLSTVKTRIPADAQEATSNLNQLSAAAEKMISKAKAISATPVSVPGAAQSATLLNEMSAAIGRVAASAKTISSIPIVSPGVAETTAQIKTLVIASEQAINIAREMRGLPPLSDPGVIKTTAQIEALNATLLQTQKAAATAQAQLESLFATSAKPITGAGVPSAYYQQTMFPGFGGPGVARAGTAGGQMYLPGYPTAPVSAPQLPTSWGGAAGGGMPPGWGNELPQFLNPKVIKEANSGFEQLHATLGRIQRTLIAFATITGLLMLYRQMKDLVGVGIEYNAMLETTKLGISSLLVSQGQFIDSNGRAVQGMEAFQAAGVLADDTLQKLQVDNLKTVATFEQLARAFQQTLAPGLEAGFNVDQVREYTLAMVQAASAMGLNLDMLAEETRSMLRGTINPRQTLIATALGIRSEDIVMHKRNASELYDYIMGKLSAFGLAGMEAQKTWSGVMSNLKDAFAIVIGKGMEGTFNKAKNIAARIQGALIIKEGGVLKPNPEAVSWVKSFSKALESTMDIAADSVGYFEKFIPPLKLAGNILWAVFGPSLENIWRGANMVVMSFYAWLDLLNPALNYINELIIAYEKWAGITPPETPEQQIQNAFAEEGITEGKPVIKVPVEFEVAPRKLKPEEIDEVLKLESITGRLTDVSADYLANIVKSLNLEVEYNNLMEEQLQILTEISRQKEKSQLPDQYRGLFDVAAYMKIWAAEEGRNATIISNRQQIAETNKDYEMQKKLIDEATENTRRKMQAENKYDAVLMKSIEDLDKFKKSEIDRARATEIAGNVEEYNNLKATAAALVGDLETQLRYEGLAQEKLIEKRKLARELRGETGKQVEDQIRINKILDDSIKISKERLDIEDQIASAVQQRAEITGDLYSQVEAQKTSQEIAIKQLDLQGKFHTRAGLLLKYQKEMNDYVKNEMFLAQGLADLEDKRLSLIGQIAEATANENKIWEVQRLQLENQILLLEKRISLATDPQIIASLQAQVDLMKELGPTRENLDRQRSFLSNNDKMTGYRMQIAEMTGNVQDYEDAVKEATDTEKARLRLEPQYADLAFIYDRYIDQLAEMNKLSREFGRQLKTQELIQQVGELSGSWEMVKNAELETLRIDYEKQMAIGGLNDKQKELLATVTKLKQLELEASKKMAVTDLMDIGLKKYSLRTTQQLVDAYENILPNAIDVTSDSMRAAVDSLADGTKSLGEAFHDFFNSWDKGLQKLILDITFMIAKMELLKALGYGQGGGMTAGGGGGSALLGWFASLFGGGGMGSAGSMGSEGLTSGGMGLGQPTGFQEGGVVTKPTLAMVGERPEVFIPLKSGRVPVEMGSGKPGTVINNFNYHIVTPDANSFRASQKQLETEALVRAGRSARRNT